jgi:hypothetical protein
MIFIIGLTWSGPPLFAIGGNATIGGAFIEGPADERAVRERVLLRATDGVLSGRPRHSSVVLITVYAPGSASQNVILKESAGADGVRSVLLTAPPSLIAVTRRLTLFVRTNDSPVFLAGSENGRRALYTPVLLTGLSNSVAGRDGGSVAAFVLGGFTGPWLLASSGHAVAGTAANERLEKQTFDTGVRRGFFPWISSLVVLSAAFLASRLAYYADTRTG